MNVKFELSGELDIELSPDLLVLWKKASKESRKEYVETKIEEYISENIETLFLESSITYKIKL